MSSSSSLRSLASVEGIVALLQSRGPEIVSGLLVIAIGLQAAALVTDALGAGDPPPIDAAAAGYPAPISGPARRSVDLLAIANAHLFGKVETPADDAANAPQTSMPLVLAGLLAADDPAAGFAIVGENAAAAKLRTVGSMLPGGARLHSVYHDRIVIERGGVLESLSLPKQILASRPLPPPPPLPTAPPNDGDIAVERVRQAVQQNPGALGDVIRSQQVMADGKQRGFRVYPGRSPAAFSRLGLRPGDLITAVNGTPLDDPSRGEEVMRTLGSAPEVRVTIMRNGRQNDMVLNMAQIASEAEQLNSAADGVLPIDQAQPLPPPGSAP
ncbi:MAG: type II secretion system protein GspC [Steroidobacteraceae bacterium]|nr:type II secretion system protein GspC [Nevskiaceae bacterium]MCP5340323.1 type II secretion system protein GspC [Nevskiaceae bacterium]MCP5359694.1 type II secretion system protein GspC [Nevskiaceae bacterium]